MRTFVLRARAASTNSQTLLANVGGDAHSEILAHTLMNAIFVAQSHRDDAVVHLVLESTQDYFPHHHLCGGGDAGYWRLP